MRRARAGASRPGAGQDDAARRIDDAVGVDAIQLRERQPQGWSDAPVVLEAAAHSDGGVRRRSAMLRRMKVAMLLADAASVADGDLDILGGGWNITKRRAWHDHACAELEVRLAQPRVPREGIAATRGEAPDGDHGSTRPSLPGWSSSPPERARQRPRVGGSARVGDKPGWTGDDSRAGAGAD
jgi:hypothetical protein